jgi:hypothetical protein
VNDPSSGVGTTHAAARLEFRNDVVDVDRNVRELPEERSDG